MNRPLRVLVSGLFVVLAFVLLLAFASYAPNQVTGGGVVDKNVMGYPGAAVAHVVIGVWGLVAYWLPLLLLGYAFALIRDHELANLGRRLIGAMLMIPVLCGLVHLLPTGYFQDTLNRWGQSELYGAGGSLGYLLCAPADSSGRTSFPGGLLMQYLEVWGSALTLAGFGALAVLLMDIGIRRSLSRLWRAVKSWRQEPPLAMPERPGRIKPVFIPGPAQPVIKNRATTSIHEITRKIAEDERAPPPDAESLIEKIRSQKRALQRGDGQPGDGLDEVSAEAVVDALAEDSVSADIPVETNSALPVADDAAPSPSAADTGTALQRKSDGRPAVGQTEVKPDAKTATAKTAARKRPQTSPGEGGYVLPSVDLLEDMPQKRSAEHDAEKHQISRAIEEVFSHFDVGVQVVNATRGPVVTQYEIRLLDQSMRVGKVEGFEKDLSMKLGTEGIRIVAPLPNKTTIGVEVPNRVKEAVVMRDLVEEVDPSTMALPIILGRDVIGRPMVGDLAKMPHLLVAGATGMGKSVCMNAMICSILLFKSPQDVKFIMIDPKMVELAGYEDIPHLLSPPITDMTRAHAALEWACRTMDERYEVLRLTGVRDIKAYNDLGPDEVRFRLAKKELRPEDLPGEGRRMSYIVVLVDEYADLMMVNKEVEKSIVRLAAKSRACGIHVILTTQRPSADVVTGLIKSNLPSRICFRVVDKSNSRVVLDVSGAEHLLGKGDMLFLQPGVSAPIRGQGVWLKDSEINAIIEHAKAQGKPAYNEEVLKVGAVQMDGGGGGNGSGSEWLQDRQFHEAVQSMYRYNRSGADFFRRKLNIGYNKATSYVEQLEDLGFVGPQKGTSPREILKSWDDWIEALKGNGVTWDEEDDLYRNPVEVGM